MDLAGGGWTLVVNRRGGADAQGGEACGADLAEFLDEGCGAPGAVDFGDSYALAAQARAQISATEFLVVQIDDGGMRDLDDAYLATFASAGQELFPADTTDPDRIFDVPLQRVCDLEGTSCDESDVFWRYTGTGTFDSAQCNASNNPGAGYGGKCDTFCTDVCTAWLSRKLQRPVKFIFEREEVFYAHRGRHREGRTGLPIRESW
jgi:hypothetical protein